MGVERELLKAFLSLLAALPSLNDVPLVVFLLPPMLRENLVGGAFAMVVFFFEVSSIFFAVYGSLDFLGIFWVLRMRMRIG